MARKPQPTSDRDSTRDLLAAPVSHRAQANHPDARLLAWFLVGFTALLLVPMQTRAQNTEVLQISGQVVRPVSGTPVRKGMAELRWPAHDDRFEPIQQELTDDGRFQLSVPFGDLPTEARDMSVGIIAEGFSVSEARLSEGTWQNETTVTLDFELSAATLDGVLDIFACCILNWSVLTVMLPAFLLGAAVKAFVPGHVFLKYLGPTAPKTVSYGAAVGSGMVLSLCSCNVVPLFLSIWRSGAGIGPAFAFLYAGPAINVLSMVFACKVIGLGIGLWRVVSVAIISVITGMFMSVVFKNSDGRRSAAEVERLSQPPAKLPAIGLVFLLLLLLIIGSLELSWAARAWTSTVPLLAVVACAVAIGREACGLWLRETGILLLKVLPILLPAVLLIGLLAQFIPLSATRWLSATNSLWANLSAASAAALMYFPIMTETAFVKTLLKVMGIGTGPAMAILLTAPGLSLPGMVIVGRDIGGRKLLTYVGAVVALSTAFGAFFGSRWGTYLCNCAFQ